MKINIEMNNKSNSLFHLNTLECIKDENILLLEKKINSFYIDKNYNYALNLSQKTNILPKININLKKLYNYYDKITGNDEKYILKDIKIINNYVKKLFENINLNVIEGLREQNIIFYLFQFLNKAFFYIFLDPNINGFQNIYKKYNLNDFSNKIKYYNEELYDYNEFFNNYILIKNSAKLYLSNDIYNNQLNELGEEQKYKIILKLRTNTNLGLYLAFDQLINFPKELKIFIKNCQIFLCPIIQIIGNNRDIKEKNNNDNESSFYKKMNLLLENYIKIFDIFHSINEIYNIIDYKYFYNYELNNNFDIKKELNLYKKNQIEKSKNDKNINNNININEEFNIYTFKNDIRSLTFTLLSYTWLFDAGSKYKLINLYNDYSKKDVIYESFSNLLPQMQQLLNENINILNDEPEIDLNNLYLTLSIRRDYLIEDTTKELSKPNINLRSPLKINFIGEEGIDQGGLKKEFFMLLTRQIFNEKDNLFTYNTKSRLFWFNLNSNQENSKYELIGNILGLSIYNSIILDIKFPLVIYKKLLKIEPSLEDIKEIDEELYHNFCSLLESDDQNLENDLDTNFTVLIEKNGKKEVLPLIENGENIMINNENKKLYIYLYINYFFNKSIEEYYLSFEKGFYKVFDEDLTKILTPEELELIICGSSNLDFYELQKVCIYKDGYDKESLTIKYFWEIVFEFDEEEKKKLLSFITGCDRAPINGLGHLIISITKIGSDINKLPSAHTCFNDLLLPDYKDRDLLKKFLLIAINYSEGFGLN